MANRPKLDSLISFSQLRSIQILTTLLFLYLLLVVFEIPLVFKQSSDIPILPSPILSPTTFKTVSGLVFDENDEFSELHIIARDAFMLGKKMLNDLESGKLNKEMENSVIKSKDEPCPNSVVLSDDDDFKNMMVIPCGLSLGSHITVVGRPRKDDNNEESGIEFVVELQGLKAVDGEAPPKILHFNPRLRGDWSKQPVIEQNTCYRMQWGSAQRCVGWKSKADEETVDGHVKCEKWIHGDDSGSEESNTRWWLKRLIGRTKKVTVDWPYPFAEDKLFVLTLIAGLEGFHVNVDGRHVSSFSYRPGFILEDATGLFLDGDVDVHSVVAASLPTMHPSTAPRNHLEFSADWKAPKSQTQPVELFIGILSAGNHFAERMSVRKSWLQYSSVKSSNVVARFFVAMVRVH